MRRKVLKKKIMETFQCPVYHPANGQVLLVDSLRDSVAAQTIPVSPALQANRMAGVAAAATFVYHCSQLDARDRLKLIAESVKIQGRPEGIAWDGYWYWSGALDSQPVLLDAQEFAARVGEDAEQFARFFQMKHSVTRFLAEKRLRLRAASGDVSCLSVIQAFLIE